MDRKGRRNSQEIAWWSDSTACWEEFAVYIDHESCSALDNRTFNNGQSPHNPYNCRYMSSRNSIMSAQRLAAASKSPVALNALLLVTTISTGYFHSMNCFQPQKANLRPKYFPMYGTRTIDMTSSNCFKLSFHSRSASDSIPSSLMVTSSESGSDEGKDSTAECSDVVGDVGCSIMEG